MKKELVSGIILLVVVSSVWGYISPNPLNETRSLLSDLFAALPDHPGVVKHTNEVVFMPDSILAASALAERLPISTNQICMSTGQFKEDVEDGFRCIGCKEGNLSQRIIYSGNNEQAVKLSVVCNTSLSLLEADIAKYGLEYSEGTSIINSCKVCEGKGNCCAVVLKKGGGIQELNWWTLWYSGILIRPLFVLFGALFLLGLALILYNKYKKTKKDLKKLGKTLIVLAIVFALLLLIATLVTPVLY